MYRQLYNRCHGKYHPWNRNSRLYNCSVQFRIQSVPRAGKAANKPGCTKCKLVPCWQARAARRNGLACIWLSTRCHCLLPVPVLSVGRVLLYVHRDRRLIRDGSLGRPPRLPHGSWALGWLGLKSARVIIIVMSVIVWTEKRAQAYSFLVPSRWPVLASHSVDRLPFACVQCPKCTRPRASPWWQQFVRKLVAGGSDSTAVCLFLTDFSVLYLFVVER